jgi:hypothetical protein
MHSAMKTLAAAMKDLVGKDEEGRSMLWFFERDAERVIVETRYDNERSEIVVILKWPDGRAHTERFAEEEACRTWLLGMEQTLQSEHWMRNGPPIILPYGWRKKR